MVITALLVLMQVKGWLDPLKTVFINSPRPVTYAVAKAAKPIKYFFSTAYNLRKITKENAALTQQVFQLQQDLVQFDQEKRENEALRKELGFAANTGLSLVPCTVMSQNPFGASDTLVLNCGSDRGVSEGQAIISQGFLVGKIIYAGKGYSTALLITSSNFTTDAKLSKTGASGVVNGSFGSGIILDQLSQSDSADKGWQVVTGGIDSRIPKNILIGEVGEVVSNSNDLFKKATLLSPIDFNGLEFVFAVK